MALFVNSVRSAFGSASFVPASYLASRSTDPASIVFQRTVGDQSLRWSHSDRSLDQSKFKTLHEIEREFRMEAHRNHVREELWLQKAPFIYVAVGAIRFAIGFTKVGKGITKFLGSEKHDTESRAV